MENSKRKNLGSDQFYVIGLAVIICFTQCKSKSSTDIAVIKAEIEKILKIQEDAYSQNNEPARIKFASTCDDSLLFVGGDDGGIQNTANFYVHDFANGYTTRPHDRTYRIYNNTVIVTSLQQVFELFNKDTIFHNTRYTKVFVKGGKDWKMAYVTYAPLPVIYTKRQVVNERILQDYVGLYQESPTVTDTVAVVEGRIIITDHGNNKSELIPMNDSTFFGNDYFGKTVFVRNNRGIVTHNYFEFPDGQRIIFPKIK